MVRLRVQAALVSRRGAPRRAGRLLHVYGGGAGGPRWFELVQPLEGPSIYKEFLETKGEGLHHVLVGWDPEEQAPGAPKQAEGELPGSVTTARDIRSRFEAAGYPVLMGGKIGASTEFYYLDTEPVMKVIVELAGGSSADLQPIATYPA